MSSCEKSILVPHSCFFFYVIEKIYKATYGLPRGKKMYVAIYSNRNFFFKNCVKNEYT